MVLFVINLYFVIIFLIKFLFQLHLFWDKNQTLYFTPKWWLILVWESVIASLISSRKLDGSFDVQVKGITISVNLLLGREPSGRPTITASGCSSHIRDVEVDVSGDLG